MNSKCQQGRYFPDKSGAYLSGGKGFYTFDRRGIYKHDRSGSYEIDRRGFYGIDNSGQYKFDDSGKYIPDNRGKYIGVFTTPKPYTVTKRLETTRFSCTPESTEPYCRDVTQTPIVETTTVPLLPTIPKGMIFQSKIKINH